MHLPPVQYSLEIPLFPLPNCVLFPGAVQPLHIFEPRYRQMMCEAMSGQAAMAMALLKPGWETTYYGCPPIHERVCVGRVIAHELLPDGKYNLLLQGVTRALVVSEARRTGDWGVYRAVRVDPLAEKPATPSLDELHRRVLRQLFEKSALKDLTVTPALASLFEESAPIARLIDALAFTLVQDCQAKQRILDELDVAMRGELLMRELVALAGRLGTAPTPAPWPPPLGVN